MIYLCLCPKTKDAGRKEWERKSFSLNQSKVVRISTRDLKPGKHNLTYPFLVLTPTHSSKNYSLSFSMNFDVFWCITQFLKWWTPFILKENKKRERAFSDKKLRVQISPVRYSTVRLWCSSSFAYLSGPDFNGWHGPHLQPIIHIQIDLSEGLFIFFIS